MNNCLRLYSKKLNAFLVRIIIQYTSASKFFNYTIIPLELMAVIDVACYTKEEYLNSIARCAA